MVEFDSEIGNNFIFEEELAKKYLVSRSWQKHKTPQIVQIQIPTDEGKIEEKAYYRTSDETVHDWHIKWSNKNPLHKNDRVTRKLASIFIGHIKKGRHCPPPVWGGWSVEVRERAAWSYQNPIWIQIMICSCHSWSSIKIASENHTCIAIFSTVRHAIILRLRHFCLHLVMQHVVGLRQNK